MHFVFPSYFSVIQVLIKKFLQTYLISIICSYTYLSCVLVVESCINRALETILRLYLQNYMAKEN